MPNTDPSFPPRLDPPPQADERPSTRTTDRLYVGLFTGLFHPPKSERSSAARVSVPRTPEAASPPTPAATSATRRRLVAGSLAGSAVAIALAWFLSAPQRSPEVAPPPPPAHGPAPEPPAAPTTAPAEVASVAPAPLPLTPMPSAATRAAAPTVRAEAPAATGKPAPHNATAPAPATPPRTAVDDDDLKRSIMH